MLLPLDLENFEDASNNGAGRELDTQHSIFIVEAGTTGAMFKVGRPQYLPNNRTISMTIAPLGSVACRFPAEPESIFIPYEGEVVIAGGAGGTPVPALRVSRDTVVWPSISAVPTLPGMGVARSDRAAESTSCDALATYAGELASAWDAPAVDPDAIFLISLADGEYAPMLIDDDDGADPEPPLVTLLPTTTPVFRAFGSPVDTLVLATREQRGVFFLVSNATVSAAPAGNGTTGGGVVVQLSRLDCSGDDGYKALDCPREFPPLCCARIAEAPDHALALDAWYVREGCTDGARRDGSDVSTIISSVYPFSDIFGCPVCYGCTNLELGEEPAGQPCAPTDTPASCPSLCRSCDNNGICDDHESGAFCNDCSQCETDGVCRDDENGACPDCSTVCLVDGVCAEYENGRCVDDCGPCVDDGVCRGTETARCADCAPCNFDGVCDAREHAERCSDCYCDLAADTVCGAREGVDCADCLYQGGEPACMAAAEAVSGSVIASYLGDDDDHTTAPPSFLPYSLSCSNESLGVVAPSQWWTVVGTGTTMTVSTCRSVNLTFDPTLTLFDDCDLSAAGACLATSSRAAGCGYGGTHRGAEVTWSSEAGRVYRVRVGGGVPWASGPFVLSVSACIRPRCGVRGGCEFCSASSVGRIVSVSSCSNCAIHSVLPKEEGDETGRRAQTVFVPRAADEATGDRVSLSYRADDLTVHLDMATSPSRPARYAEPDYGEVSDSRYLREVAAPEVAAARGGDAAATADRLLSACRSPLPSLYATRGVPPSIVDSSINPVDLVAPTAFETRRSCRQLSTGEQMVVTNGTCPAGMETHALTCGEGYADLPRRSPDLPPWVAICPGPCLAARGEEEGEVSIQLTWQDRLPDNDPSTPDTHGGVLPTSTVAFAWLGAPQARYPRQVFRVLEWSLSITRVDDDHGTGIAASDESPHLVRRTVVDDTSPFESWRLTVDNLRVEGEYSIVMTYAFIACPRGYDTEDCEAWRAPRDYYASFDTRPMAGPAPAALSLDQLLVCARDCTFQPEPLKELLLGGSGFRPGDYCAAGCSSATGFRASLRAVWDFEEASAAPVCHAVLVRGREWEVNVRIVVETTGETIVDTAFTVISTIEAEGGATPPGFDSRSPILVTETVGAPLARETLIRRTARAEVDLAAWLSGALPDGFVPFGPVSTATWAEEECEVEPVALGNYMEPEWSDGGGVWMPEMATPDYDDDDDGSVGGAGEGEGEGGGGGEVEEPRAEWSFRPRSEERVASLSVRADESPLVTFVQPVFVDPSSVAASVNVTLLSPETVILDDDDDGEAVLGYEVEMDVHLSVRGRVVGYPNGRPGLLHLTVSERGDDQTQVGLRAAAFGVDVAPLASWEVVVGAMNLTKAVFSIGVSVERVRAFVSMESVLATHAASTRSLVEASVNVSDDLPGWTSQADEDLSIDPYAARDDATMEPMTPEQARVALIAHLRTLFVLVVRDAVAEYYVVPDEPVSETAVELYRAERRETDAELDKRLIPLIVFLCLVPFLVLGAFCLGKRLQKHANRGDDPDTENATFRRRHLIVISLYVVVRVVFSVIFSLTMIWLVISAIMAPQLAVLEQFPTWFDQVNARNRYLLGEVDLLLDGELYRQAAAEIIIKDECDNHILDLHVAAADHMYLIHTYHIAEKEARNVSLLRIEISANNLAEIRDKVVAAVEEGQEAVAEELAELLAKYKALEDAARRFRDDAVASVRAKLEALRDKIRALERLWANFKAIYEAFARAVNALRSAVKSVFGWLDKFPGVSINGLLDDIGWPSAPSFPQFGSLLPFSPAPEFWIPELVLPDLPEVVVPEIEVPEFQETPMVLSNIVDALRPLSNTSGGGPTLPRGMPLTIDVPRPDIEVSFPPIPSWLAVTTGIVLVDILLCLVRQLRTIKTVVRLLRGLEDKKKVDPDDEEEELAADATDGDISAARRRRILRKAEEKTNDKCCGSFVRFMYKANECMSFKGIGTWATVLSYVVAFLAFAAVVVVWYVVHSLVKYYMTVQVLDDTGLLALLSAGPRAALAAANTRAMTNAETINLVTLPDFYDRSANRIDDLGTTMSLFDQQQRAEIAAFNLEYCSLLQLARPFDTCDPVQQVTTSLALPLCVRREVTADIIISRELRRLADDIQQTVRPYVKALRTFVLNMLFVPVVLLGIFVVFKITSKVLVSLFVRIGLVRKYRTYLFHVNPVQGTNLVRYKGKFGEEAEVEDTPDHLLVRLPKGDAKEVAEDGEATSDRRSLSGSRQTRRVSSRRRAPSDGSVPLAPITAAAAPAVPERLSSARRRGEGSQVSRRRSVRHTLVGQPSAAAPFPSRPAGPAPTPVRPPPRRDPVPDPSNGKIPPYQP
jgi:hypothetical protein